MMAAHTDRIAIAMPLAVATIAFIVTTLVHALTLSVIVGFVRRERTRGLAGANFWVDVAIVALVIFVALAAHLLEISFWATLFMVCGEFQEFGAAFDHSAVNYTTLGYGDVVMSTSWKLLGPLESANGMLMFGVSTAMVFAIIQRLLETRFADLRD